MCIRDRDSLIAKLVEKMEIHLPSFIERAKKALEQKTKVSGDVQLMISQSLNKEMCIRDRAYPDGTLTVGPTADSNTGEWVVVSPNSSPKNPNK